MEPKLRGFATLTPAKRAEMASKGGKSVPSDKRSFSQNRALAKDAGRKGGINCAPECRSFSTNPQLAKEAGRKGGTASRRTSKREQVAS